MCVGPRHEVFNAEVGDAGLSERLCHAKTTNGLPKNFHEHPVVKGNPNEDVLLVALYTDAVPYSLTDSVVECGSSTCCQSITCIVKKNIVCNAAVGSGARATLFVLVEWCCRCLSDGVFPSTKHDGAPCLPDSDSERPKLAGTRTKNRAACIPIRGD